LFVPQAWTLGLELQFYLLAPFIVKGKLRWIVLLAGLLLVGRIMIFEQIREVGIPIDDAAFFPMQFQYFLLGAVGYHVYRWLRGWSAPEQLKRALGLICMLFAIVMIFRAYDTLQGSQRRTYDIFYLLFAATVPFMFYLTKNWKWDSRIGEYSYPIYLFHFTVNAIFWKSGDANWRGEVVLLITIGICTLYIYLVDRPVQRFRARLVSRSAPTRAPDLSLTVPVTP
jgi:peptidoglycan/LPS O-acetylase OafA/YrhL